MWNLEKTLPYQKGNNSGASSDAPTAVSKSDYLSTVLDVKLNYEYAAVIMEGKVRLHKVRKTSFKK